MFRGIESVGVVFLIFAIGYFFHCRKIWPEATPGALSSIVIWISAPCLAITSIVSGYDREMLARALIMFLIAAIHLFAMMLLGKGSSRLLGLGGGRRVIYEVSFTFSNVIFIGLPVNQIVFGESGLPTLFAYYILSLLCFWSFGVYQIASAAQGGGGHEGPIAQGGGGPDASAAQATPPVGAAHPRSAISARRIFNPGLIGALAGYGLVQAGLGLPPIIGPALGYLANLTVPLSLLVIGANLTMFSKGIPRICRDEVFVMLAKFAVSPALMFGLLRAFGISGLPFHVFLLSSSMPCHMQSSILAQHYGVEPAYASKLVGLSTLLSIVTIPCYVAFVHNLIA